MLRERREPILWLRERHRAILDPVKPGVTVRREAEDDRGYEIKRSPTRHGVPATPLIEARQDARHHGEAREHRFVPQQRTELLDDEAVRDEQWTQDERVDTDPG